MLKKINASPWMQMLLILLLVGAVPAFAGMDTYMRSLFKKSGDTVEIKNGRSLSAGLPDGTTDQVPTNSLVLKTSRIDPNPRQDDVTFITKFQAGHGWTATGSTIELNDTTDGTMLFGSQCISYIGDEGANSELNKTLASTNLSNKIMIFYFKFSDPTAFSGQHTLYLASGGSWVNYVYYNISVSDLTPNEWHAFPVVLSKYAYQAGTMNFADVQNIRLRISDPDASTSVWFGGVGYMDKSTGYANGVVVITFDDASESVWTQARPGMETYGYPGVVYVIGQAVESNTYLTVANLKALEKFYGWEVAGHADRSADHVDMTTLSENEIRDSFSRLKNWLAVNGFKGQHVAYPYGAHNADVRRIANDYFVTGRALGGEGVYNWMLPPLAVNTRRLAAVSFSYDGATVADIQSLITSAAAHDLTLLLLFHNIVASGGTGATINRADFDTILSSINSSGVDVKTLSDTIVFR